MVATLAQSAAILVFPGLMIYAGIADLTTMTIRNVLVLALLAAYFVLAPLAGFPLAAIGWSAALGLGVLAIAFVLFSFGWIGGGDAKLAAVTAIWFGPQDALVYFVYASLLGGVLTFAILQMRGWPLPSGLYRIGWITRLHERTAGIPYGAAMAPAALIVFPHTAWMANLT
ncbi:A24 family peptidase [Propylenella binzhouense]|uniref:Peptidase n=1 Tax=Propylenella binzhouense TaxID=2555902 RepID=A0A964T5A1_9HYPH|nr:prepilin peptidase [Propylenella binzhouense]MYZ48675.1 peptidase [Propylenella binzhouense]